MGYVVAGYSIVLSLLFLYCVQLAWRRRRVIRAAERVIAYEAGVTGVAGVAGVAGTTAGAEEARGR
jgi:hypothetical protein